MKYTDAVTEITLTISTLLQTAVNDGNRRFLLNQLKKCRTELQKVSETKEDGTIHIYDWMTFDMVNTLIDRQKEIISEEQSRKKTR